MSIHKHALLRMTKGGVEKMWNKKITIAPPDLSGAFNYAVARAGEKGSTTVHVDTGQAAGSFQTFRQVGAVIDNPKYKTDGRTPVHPRLGKNFDTGFYFGQLIINGYVAEFSNRTDDNAPYFANFQDSWGEGVFNAMEKTFLRVLEKRVNLRLGNVFHG